MQTQRTDMWTQGLRKGKCESLSHVQLFVIPWTVASSPDSSVHIFSRQEYWSGLPIPSPGDLSDSEIELRSPALQADSLISEPPGKPKNTGVGSLSLLQGNFPTQESNQGLLHCRWILYQLCYQGSLRKESVGQIRRLGLKYTHYHV